MFSRDKKMAILGPNVQKGLKNKEGHGVCLENFSTALGAYIPKFWHSIILFPDGATKI